MRILSKFRETVSLITVIAAKTASALNPLVYAASHPKYREALAKEFPSLGIGKWHISPSFFPWVAWVF
jgi:hypothetical protein